MKHGLHKLKKIKPPIALIASSRTQSHTVDHKENDVTSYLVEVQWSRVVVSAGHSVGGMRGRGHGRPEVTRILQHTRMQ